MKLYVLLPLFSVFALASAAETCDLSVLIKSSTQVFENNDKIEFQHKLNSKEFAYIIEYWIEDEDGGTVKQKRNTTNTNKKTFTPKNIASDIIIKSNLTVLGCNDLNQADNFAEKRIFLADSSSGNVVVSFGIDKSAEKIKNLNINTNKNPKNTRILGLVPYFLITLLTIISIVLIWRR